MDHKTRLEAQQLRWEFDTDCLKFDSTLDVDPAEGVVGQPVAVEAIRFGVECDAPGQNIFVRGLTGTGRMTLVQSVLDELKPKPRRQLDRCYVHNFTQPDRPRLITLKAGEGPSLRRQMRDAAEFIEQRLGDFLEAGAAKARLEAIQETARNTVAQISKPLEKELHENGLTLVQVKTGPVARSAVFPLRDGEPLAPEAFRKLTLTGEIDEQEASRVEALILQYNKRVEEVGAQVAQAWRDGAFQARKYVEEETRSVLELLFKPLQAEFDSEPLNEFVEELINDVLEQRLPGNNMENLPNAAEVYGVNVVCSHAERDTGPVITENSPTVSNLLGSIEADFVAAGQPVSNYRGIRAGALVHADGGFLVVDAHDLITEPGAWRLVMRALRTGMVEIVPAELGWPRTSQSIKPEPIDIQVRVILIGSSGLYYKLDQVDHDFADLFKVLADFDSEVERSEAGVRQYAGVLARLSRDEKLLPFSACAVGAMAEHGARIAARRDKLTARFGRVADIAREAAFLAQREGADKVQREHVLETVKRTRYRASLPSQRYQQLIADRTIRLETTGSVVGQINGMAVIHAGPLSYGFPARITATVGAGRAGVINIEGASSLSGNIHTKGFHILGGLLRHILRIDHPLAFSASIAFEQSYGGIDGDSASGAEFCCLISAITDVPLRQGIAMTGAIDQLGHVQAIGGVNEKVDGHFDACRSQGLNGEQGAIIPLANAGDLMLRRDVVDACREGRFHIYAVDNVAEAMEVLTGRSAGDPDSTEPYDADSLFALAQEKAGDFLRMSMNRKPGSNGADESKDD